ncbi:MAG: tRNA pseudouridine(38-40) synthase TruA [Balneolaceae bacterium]
MNRVRWKLTLAYDGRHFFGWQRQPDCRTVQGELESALSRFSDEEIHVTGQGRTDRGVHALGQTAHTDLPSRVTEERLIGAMRGLLPDDIRLLRAEPVSPDFHARFHAVSRRYGYQLSTRPDLLNRHQRWELNRTPDLNRLNQYASILTGRHDFGFIARTDAEEERSTVCTMEISRWVDAPDGLRFTIEGDRFLRHLVRRMVGTMIRLEADEIPVEKWESRLSGESEDAQIYTAPPHGLILLNVRYP